MNAVGMSRTYGSRQNSTIDSNGKSDAQVRKTNIHFLVYVFLRFTGSFFRFSLSFFLTPLSTTDAHPLGVTHHLHHQQPPRLVLLFPVYVF
jgi:hypothetical protein